LRQIILKLRIMNKLFGKLEKVDLRELWNGEASDFTPWLSKEDNIAQLGDAIGIELEVQDQEHRIGVFRADILCKDIVNDHFVLIENQLERTDHNHLGQLITYAAGLEAVTIIWVAKAFAEEHRAALDWLNNITDESINFFGIEIETYKIGDSLPAPNFKIIAKPNNWSKRVKSAVSPGRITAIGQEYLDFYNEISARLGQRLSQQLKEPKPISYYQIETGISAVHFEWGFHVRPKGCFGVELHLERWDHNYNKNLLNKLIHLQEKLEMESSEKLIIQENWGQKWARMYFEYPNRDMGDKIKMWAVDNMEIMIRNLQPEIDKIKKSPL